MKGYGEIFMADFDTSHSKDYSDEGFWDKILSCVKSAGIVLIYKALQLYYVMQRPDCPLWAKGTVIAALGYFISPIDAVPDFIPFVGFSDDAAVIAAALLALIMYIDEEVKRQARQAIDNIFGAGTAASYDLD